MVAVGDRSQGVRASDPDPATALDVLRSRIDELDAALVKLLNARAACALEIGAIKLTEGMPVYQPTREDDVIAHVTAINDGPLKAEGLTRLFERIIDETRRLQPGDGPTHAEDHEGE